MKARLHLLWDWMHSSYWFLPGVLLLAAAGAAFGLTALDHRLGEKTLDGMSWVYGGGPEGARSVLLAIASSILGVAGTTFAITIAVLSLTSSQFGPRLLRNFLKDTGSQLVLGTFIGTFLYALLVLRTVRSSEADEFVPHLAVTFALVLAVLSIAMLVYFIQHTVASIQASQIIDTASAELVDAVERLYPEAIGEEPARAAPPESIADAAAQVRAARSGYLQAVDGDALLALAVEHDARIELLRMPGQFVTAGTVLARVAPARRLEALAPGIDSALSLGAHPTQVQDILFSVNQLAEIATRALSPGTNDPNTAIMCIDRLNQGLCRLAGRPFPPNWRADEGGRARLREGAVLRRRAARGFRPDPALRAPGCAGAHAASRVDRRHRLVQRRGGARRTAAARRPRARREPRAERAGGTRAGGRAAPAHPPHILDSLMALNARLKAGTSAGRRRCPASGATGRAGARWRVEARRIAARRGGRSPRAARRRRGC